LKIRTRLFHSLWLGLLLLILAVPVAVFTAVKWAEDSLRAERRFGEARIRLYGPNVSPLLAVTADSLTLLSPGFRLHLVRPSARLIDWFSLRPSSSALYVQVDSAALRLYDARDSAGPALAFPAALRFPVSAGLEWRVLSVQTSRGPRLDLSAGSLRSRGRLGLQGEFLLNPFAADPARASLQARVKFRAHWRGPVLRYEVEALREKRDRVFVSGVRDKRDLRRGEDSLEIYSARPADWLPPGTSPAAVRALEAISEARARGRADWKERNVQVTGSARTGEHAPLRPCAWTFEARATPIGGALALAGSGGGQSFRARGKWSHPAAWPPPGDPRRSRGEFSGESRGGEWVIGRWTLPLDFELTEGRLDTGLNIRGHVVTGDKSEVDLAWSGSRPGRLEFSGPVSPREAWAVAWTDTNVSFRDARLEGKWEDGRVTGVTHFHGVRAYGAVADSVEAGHEVTASAYTLRSARIYKDGEVFTGSGLVRWRAPTGAHAVSLRFEARHPEYGYGAFEMPRPGVIEATADNLRVALFPYEPLARFSAFNPWLDGRFRWDMPEGTGEADLRASYSNAGNVLQARLQADWDKDSLRTRSAEMTTGPSRVVGEGVLPLHGRSLRGAYGLQTLMGGTWRVGADSLRIGDVYALVGRSARVIDGYVKGRLEYSPAGGLAGELNTGPLRIPALREWAEVGGISLRGMGDSLRVTALTVSKQHALLNDSMTAVFSGLDSRAPRFWFQALSGTGFRMRVEGSAPEWKSLEGRLEARGSIPLANHAGAQTLDDVVLEGDFSAPLDRGFLSELRMDARRFQVRYAIAGDTQTLAGTPAYADGALIIPDLVIRDARGGGVGGSFTATAVPLSARLDFAGARVSLALAQGHRFAAEEVAGRAEWTAGKELTASLSARSGSFSMPPTPYRVQGSYDALRVAVTLPPPGPTPPPSRLFARVAVHDFFFERRIKFGFKEVWGLFSSLGRPRAVAGTSKRSRSWDLDVGVEAKGTHNRIDTDVLRMTFIGEMTLQGIPPYTLVNGRVTGLQGEVGQAQQAYTIRDLDVKWDNATLQDGVLLAEGEKRLRADCRPDTRTTCMMYIKLDGRLQDVNFTYDTDCGQTTGEPVAPAVLLRSMTQGCYAAELQSGETGYGNAAVGIVEPVINAQLTRGVARRSGGFIKSTQVSGLGALMGSDSSGFEALAIEVESKEVLRTGFKARIGYRPETKQSDPTEYRVAAEYRPPVEKWAADSAWRTRLKDRFTVEAAVETRPETRDFEEDRQVRQRAGLRYRYRFWGLW
jgi:hypothetical protein